MPDQYAEFTLDQSRRIARTVIDHEREGSDTSQTRQTATVRPVLEFLAKITGHTVATSPHRHWRYSFSEVIRDPAAQDGFTLLTNGRAGDATNTSAGALYAINSADGPAASSTDLPNPVTGSPVVMLRYGYFVTSVPSTIPVYTFWHTPTVGTLFAVDVVQNGGANGTVSGPAAATWTYDVYTAGNSGTSAEKLASTATVKCARPEPGPRTAATNGWAYWSSSGSLVLYDVREPQGAVACTSGGG